MCITPILPSPPHPSSNTRLPTTPSSHILKSSSPHHHPHHTTYTDTPLLPQQFNFHQLTLAKLVSLTYTKSPYTTNNNTTQPKTHQQQPNKTCPSPHGGSPWYELTNQPKSRGRVPSIKVFCHIE